MALNLPALEGKYTVYYHFHGNISFGKILTTEEPIRTRGFTYRFCCRLRSILDHLLKLHYIATCLENHFYLF